MSTPLPSPDPAVAAKGYAHPEALVSTQWVADHLDAPWLRVLECDEDVLLYDLGHVPGAQKLDWHTDLNDPVQRDYVDRAAFEQLVRRLGIDGSHVVVFYGDKNNWWAAYALWIFRLFAWDPARLKLMDGGRAKWEAEGRAMTEEVPRHPATSYSAPERDDRAIRAFRDDALAHMRAGRPMIDVRSPQEFTGERTHMPDYPQEGTLRGGHIPGRRACRGRAPPTRRHVQAGRRAAGDLRGRGGAPARRRRGGLLPHRRAVEPHVVRAHPAPRLRAGAQLRRELDRVGERRARADRDGPAPRPRRRRRA
jgi:thiosulfate/3-mercaptopyruvate sulfurtransferase